MQNLDKIGGIYAQMCTKMPQIPQRLQRKTSHINYLLIFVRNLYNLKLELLKVLLYYLNLKTTATICFSPILFKFCSCETGLGS